MFVVSLLSLYRDIDSNVLTLFFIMKQNPVTNSVVCWISVIECIQNVEYSDLCREKKRKNK